MEKAKIMEQLKKAVKEAKEATRRGLHADIMADLADGTVWVNTHADSNGITRYENKSIIHLSQYMGAMYGPVDTWTADKAYEALAELCEVVK